MVMRFCRAVFNAYRFPSELTIVQRERESTALGLLEAQSELERAQATVQFLSARLRRLNKIQQEGIQP